jgi:hypothetical protein
VHLYDGGQSQETGKIMIFQKGNTKMGKPIFLLGNKNVEIASK